MLMYNVHKDTKHCEYLGILCFSAFKTSLRKYFLILYSCKLCRDVLKPIQYWFSLGILQFLTEKMESAWNVVYDRQMEITCR